MRTRPSWAVRIGARIVVAAVVCAAAFATQAQADTPDHALIKKVRYYYQINKHRANRGYGCNWFRVLIAFGDRTAGEWPGYGSCALTPYTATEARTSEKVWWGWRPVRQALEQLETAQSVEVVQEVVEVAPFRSGAALNRQLQTLPQQAQLPVIGFSQATACEGHATKTPGVATEQTDSNLWCSVQSSLAITNLDVNYEILEDSGSNYIDDDDSAVARGETLNFNYGWDVDNHEQFSVSTTYRFRVVLKNDFVTEPDGRAEIRLLPGDGYTLGSIIQTSVVLYDNDDYTTDSQFNIALSHREAASQEAFSNHSHYTPGDLIEIQLSTGFPFSTKSIPVILKLTSTHGEFLGTNGLAKVSGEEAYELEVTIPPLAKDTRVTIVTKADENFDFDTNVYGYINVKPRLRDHRRNFHGMSIELRPIKPPPPSDFDSDLSGYTARQCVEKNVPSELICGIGKQQVMIEYAHNPDVLHTEEDIAFFVYPSSPRTPSVQVKATWTGFHNGDKTFTIPKSGSRITLPVDDNDQFNGNLTVKFETINSTHSIPDAYRRFTVQVEDNDPTEWSWTPNTLGTPDEGSHPKVAKISFSNGISKRMRWPRDAVTDIDFNIQGCALSAQPVIRTASVPGDIPCHIHLDGTPGTITRFAELDKFRIVGPLSNAIAVTFEVGQDDDMDDEEITINPVIVLDNNGGIVRSIANDSGELPPTSFIAYDDEVTNRNATTEPTYVSFSLASYTAVESTGPSQPVLQAHQYNQDVLDTCLQTHTLQACFEDSAVVATKTTNDTFIDTVLIPIVLTFDGTASPADLYPHYDTGIIIGPSGAGKMDIHMVTDGEEELTETFTVSLGSPLPPGVLAGEIPSATIKILDSDPTVPEAYQRQQAENDRLARIELEQRCTDDPNLAECTPTVKVKTLTKELTDSQLTSDRTAAISVQLTATRDVTNEAMAFQLENQKGDRANETHTTQLSGITLAAGVPKEHTFNAEFHSVKNGAGDYPDGQVLVKFQPHGSLNFEQPERDNLMWVRDGAIDQSTAFTVQKPTSDDYADNTDGNLFHFGTAFRDLMSWETVEIPIIVEGRGGATVTTDDYRIEAVGGQNNLRVRKRNDGTYTAILTGKNTDPTTTSTDTFTCGTQPLNTSRQGCLRYVNQRKGTNGLDHSYDITIRLDPTTDGRYGQTKNTAFTVSTGSLYQVDTRVSPGHAPAGAARTIKIVPVDSTTITEPALDPVPSKSLTQRKWTDHAFDVVIDPSPASLVHFDFCLSPDPDEQSTASYYFDLRIVDEMDSRHNIAVGGLAWDRTSNCTKGQATRKTKTRYYLRVHGDSHDEGTETFALRVRVNQPNTDNVSSNGAITKWTITNDGPIPAAWLARFGRTVAQQALDGIAGRLAAPRTPGTQGTIAGRALNFGAPDRVGHENPFGGEEPGSPDWPPGRTLGFDGDSTRVGPGGMTTGASGGGPPAPALTLRDVLRGSSFTATGQPDATGGSVALWGRAAQATFDGREGATSLDGEVTTGLLGVDYARDRWLVGVSLLQSTGTGGYANIGARSQPCPADGSLSAEKRTDPCKGMVETTLTAAVPYASLQASEQLRLWGAAGYGRGTVRVETGMGETLRTDVDWSMATLGLRGTVLAPTPEGNGPALAVTSDALWAGTDSEKTRGMESSDSDVTRLRLGLEGSWQMALDELGQLKPTLAVGARHDGGDAETGFGVELGGGLAWAVPTVGLALNVEGRTLLTHREEDFQDQGVAASFTFDPDPATPLGPSLTLRQDWGGQATGGLDALFAPDPLAQRQGTAAATSRWATEAAWGFPVFDGSFTGSPHVGLGLATGIRDYRLGWRLVPATPASALSVGLQATRQERDAARPEHTVGLEITTRW